MPTSHVERQVAMHACALGAVGQTQEEHWGLLATNLIISVRDPVSKEVR